LCEEVFDDRDSAERHRLKMAASQAGLDPDDVRVVPEAGPASGRGALRLPEPVWAPS
jgi:hypothetical protein